MDLFLHQMKKLEAWHAHYKFLRLDSSDYRLSKDFWNDFNALRNFGIPRPREWEN